MLKVNSLLVQENDYFPAFQKKYVIHLPFENNATSSSSSLVVFVFDCKQILKWSLNLCRFVF